MSLRKTALSAIITALVMMFTATGCATDAVGPDQYPASISQFEPSDAANPDRTASDEPPYDYGESYEETYCTNEDDIVVPLNWCSTTSSTYFLWVLFVTTPYEIDDKITEKPKGNRFKANNLAKRKQYGISPNLPAVPRPDRASSTPPRASSSASVPKNNSSNSNTGRNPGPIRNPGGGSAPRPPSRR